MSEAPARPPMRGDLTEGPIMRTLLLFSVPTLIGNSLQSLSGTVNSIWVGRLIGEEALSATANANIIMFLVFSAAFGFGMAGTVKIGQRFGARDIDGARRTLGTAVGFCTLLGVAIAAAGWIGAPALLDAMHTPPGAYEMALTYLRLIFLSMPPMIASIIITMGLRGTGDARTPLIFLLVTVVLDAIFNPLLIAGYGPFPALGIAGSALSTMFASMVSFLAMLVYVYRKDLLLRLRGAELAYLKPARDEMTYIVTKGLPMGAQMLIMSASGIIVLRLVNEEGLLTSAAYGAAMQLFTYIQMPAMAVGGAVSAMAAQFIGAKKWHTLDHITRAGVLVNFILTGVLTLTLLLVDRHALGLFLGPDSPAVPIGRHIQLLASWNFVLFGVTMVYSATMRAGGAVWVPLVIIAISLYPIRLGFYYLTYFWPGTGEVWLGADAIWLGFPVSALASLAMAWFWYHKSSWRDAAMAESAAEAAEQSHADGEPAGRLAPDL